MAMFPAFLDTCTLYGAYLCDSLLRLAEAGTYRPLWSADVLDELERALVARGLENKAVTHRIGEMRRAFPDAEVRGYENLVETMTCDPKDRHVLAAAVRSDAAVLVTFNTDDFPDTSTAAYDITVVHPDDFLLDQLDLYPGHTVAALRDQARSLLRSRHEHRGSARAPCRSGRPEVRRGGPAASMASRPCRLLRLMFSVHTHPAARLRAGFRRLPAGGDGSLRVVTHVRLHVGDDRRGIRAFGVQVGAGVVLRYAPDSVLACPRTPTSTGVPRERQQSGRRRGGWGGGSCDPA